MIETLTCQSCGEPFHRRRRRGPKPSRCIPCEMARPARDLSTVEHRPSRNYALAPGQRIPASWKRFGS